MSFFSAPYLQLAFRSAPNGDLNFIIYPVVLCMYVHCVVSCVPCYVCLLNGAGPSRDVCLTPGIRNACAGAALSGSAHYWDLIQISAPVRLDFSTDGMKLHSGMDEWNGRSRRERRASRMKKRRPELYGPMCPRVLTIPGEHIFSRRGAAAPLDEGTELWTISWENLRLIPGEKKERYERMRDFAPSSLCFWWCVLSPFDSFLYVLHMCARRRELAGSRGYCLLALLPLHSRAATPRSGVASICRCAAAAKELGAAHKSIMMAAWQPVRGWL